MVKINKRNALFGVIVRLAAVFAGANASARHEKIKPSLDFSFFRFFCRIEIRRRDEKVEAAKKAAVFVEKPQIQPSLFDKYTFLPNLF